MKLDETKIDDAVLALLRLGLHDECRAWKGFDWDAMARLHAKGFIANPRGKTKSVILTDAGLTRSEDLLQRLFCTDE
ncbi:MAG: DUF6429 family protein [Beijerinckiaceae bacterium]